ncbi:hypothetical protein [Kribbella speibonae]|uniref:hypothetical protein n=1 Tax=Kribbella speibonae TaxID=1572660 RepID=UPI0013F49587|nr:hypothetical protein [Kribbella speibonae]
MADDQAVCSRIDIQGPDQLRLHKEIKSLTLNRQPWNSTVTVSIRAASDRSISRIT